MAGHIEERTRGDGSLSYRLIAYAGGGRYIKETLPPQTTRKQAERALAALVTDIGRKQRTPDDGQTLSQWWEQWWQ